MANRLLLKLYVASAAKGERSLARSKLVVSEAVRKFLLDAAPILLENLEHEGMFEIKRSGKNKLLTALRLANQNLLNDVVPIVVCKPNIDVELYFNDSVITNAFKNNRIEAWAASNYVRRSGYELLEYSTEWCLLHHFVNELGAEICYNPLEDKTMVELIKEVRQSV